MLPPLDPAAAGWPVQTQARSKHRRHLLHFGDPPEIARIPGRTLSRDSGTYSRSETNHRQLERCSFVTLTLRGCGIQPGLTGEARTPVTVPVGPVRARV